MMKRIPGTDRLFPTKKMNGDVFIDMTNYPELDSTQQYEDIPAVGSYIDHTGSLANFKNPQEVAMGGNENQLDLIARSEGEHLPNLNERGVAAGTHFQRAKIIQIEAEF